MLTISYLANEFPCAVEPYVVEEIQELRRRGVHVVTASVHFPRANTELAEIVLRAPSIGTVIRAVWLCLRRWDRIAPLVVRVLFRGREGPLQRLKAVIHTFLGACYAVRLKDRGVGHIHVHHGYFGSWVGMTAARLMGVKFSMTLHGSDLLLHGTYLDAKLQNCEFCLTVSEFNRRYILDRYVHVDPKKVAVTRLGVDVSERAAIFPAKRSATQPLTLLAVGRLHAVKDHAFLIQACAQLHSLDLPFECFIAGEGPERRQLEGLIRKCGLEERVTLLGHVPREQMASLYDRADDVVLTSRSEGIPLVLMEAMARGRIVLAPAITGIPELIIPGKTGFLYHPGAMDDFIDRLLFIHSLIRASASADQRHVPHIRSSARLLDWVRHGAHTQVRCNFNRQKNLESFADSFLRRTEPQSESIPDENLVLQQI
jgi:colanic acid/amylovoran biosynthesis glycosyltransferase